MGETAVFPQTYHYYGDMVQGDVIHGDKVAGHKIQTQTYVEKQIIVHGAEITDLEHLPPEAGDSPYQGLHYFEEKDADWFFGRERVTVVLVNRLHETNFLAVVGASGSGKSSVVRAGVIPALKGSKPLSDGSVPPLGDWQVQVMTPTARPLEKLVDTLFPDDNARQASVYGRLVTDTNALCDNLADQLTPEQPLLLVIDQFEELFSQCKDKDQREMFIANVAAVAQPNCKIIIAVRADFYAACLRYEPLRRVLKEGQEPLGSMRGEELRAVILEPAAKGKWKVQEGLTEQLLEDVGQEPGVLPLLSHALRETWERRRGRVLTLSGYRAAGGVKGAITQTAERVYQSLASKERAIAQQIFLRLTEFGEGTQDTRRCLDRAELPNDPLTIQMVKKLADARLITTTESSMEVTHEALIREWPRLREWLNNGREGLMIRRRLTNAAGEWQEKGKENSLVYQGLRLAEAEQWAIYNPNQLNEQEQAFLQASIAERERQRATEAQHRQTAADLQTQKRVGRVLRWSMAGIGLFLLLAIAATWQAVTARQTVQELKNAIQASQLSLAAQSELAKDPERGLLLAVAGLRLNVQPNTHAVLAEGLQSPYRTTLRGHEEVVWSAVFSPDGQTILTASSDGTARLWDRQGNTLAILRGHDGTVNSAVFDPDGQTILTAGDDGTARLWDRQGNTLAILRGHDGTVNSAVFDPDGQTILTAGDGTARLWDRQGNTLAILRGHDGTVNSAVFSPDGQTILTADAWDSTAQLWDRQGNTLAVLSGHAGWVRSAMFSPDGQTILTAACEDFNCLNGTARLWDRRGNTLAVLSGRLDSAVFSPDGQTILTAGSDGTAQLWNRQGKELAILREGHIYSAVFSPDGQTILTAGHDGTARLWDRQGNTLAILSGHEGWVRSAMFSPDGQTILTASDDSTARLWDRLGNALAILRGHEGSVNLAVFDPDGQTILTASDDSTARLWDRQGGTLAILHGHEDLVNSAVFSPDGQTILTTGCDEIEDTNFNCLHGTVRLWDREGNTLAILSGHEDWVRSAVFSPDGQTILTSGEADGTARLWAREGNTLAILSGHDNRLDSAVFDPDGQTILTASRDSTARLWDRQGNTLAILRGHDGWIYSAVFSPDGQTILTASSDGTARLWDRQGNALVILSGHEEVVWSAVFSPDGQTILTASSDGTARLWDRQGNTLAILSGHEDWVRSAVFSPDGKTILTAGDDGTARLWDRQGSTLAILSGQESWVNSAVFSPDGQTILTASSDGTARLWSLWPNYITAYMVQEAYLRLQRGFTETECQQYFRDDPADCPRTKEELFAPLVHYLTNP
ncbi:MAG: WD40 repeat domain-containing protein [Anaerolineaceae bacterium]|nr:WD40 repeat domain-containing protein [Anaerolineaceae bacterium]